MSYQDGVTITHYTRVSKNKATQREWISSCDATGSQKIRNTQVCETRRYHKLERIDKLRECAIKEHTKYSLAEFANIHAISRTCARKISKDTGVVFVRHVASQASCYTSTDTVFHPTLAAFLSVFPPNPL